MHSWLCAFKSDTEIHLLEHREEVAWITNTVAIQKDLLSLHLKQELRVHNPQTNEITLTFAAPNHYSLLAEQLGARASNRITLKAP